MLAVDKLEAIVKSKSNDPSILAELAGGDPRSFYRGANFNNADLRGVDLRGYNLTAATFENARVDRNTQVDEAYISVVGLQRTTIIIPYLSFSSGVVILKLHEVAGRDYLGDIVDESIRNLELKVGNLHKFLSENVVDESSKVGMGGRLLVDESNWRFYARSIFPQTMTSIGSGKTRSFLSNRDVIEKIISQSPVDLLDSLLDSDEGASNLNDIHGARKTDEMKRRTALMKSKLMLKKKHLKVALLLSTHKKLMGLSGVTKGMLRCWQRSFCTSTPIALILKKDSRPSRKSSRQ